MKYRTLMKTGLALLLSVCTISNSILPVHATSQDPVVTTETVTDENAQNNLQTDTLQDDEGTVETEVSDTETSEADSNTVTDNGVDITDDKSDIAEDESDITIDSEDSSEKSSDDEISIEASDDVTNISLLDEMKSEDDTDVHSSDDSCYIKAYEVSEVLDGTAPFDADNNAGNDSSNKNGIVRSFDAINYTLKYTTAIKDSTLQGIDSANVMVDFELPCDPKKAEFNVDTMTWILDKKLVYQYADGSESTKYDSTKEVVCQKLTGRRLLVNNESGNTVPGTGTLAIGVNVNAAVTGDVIHPTFTIWMEGNADTEKKTVDVETTVSAAPKYDIEIKRNANANILGYYNPENKTATADYVNEGDLYGRLQYYTLSLRLQNDSAAKGMKGIEFPDGSDITFDLRMSESVNDKDVSNEADYKPLLWDYAMDNGSKSKGVLGRPMYPLGQSIASQGNWTTNTPWNTGNSSGGCYNGGSASIQTDVSDSNLLHVTLSGYQLDMKDFDFPNRWSGASYVSIASNIGYISVCGFQLIGRFQMDVDTIENVGIVLEASNFHAHSMSGIDVNSEVNTTNNISSVRVTTYPSGSHSKRNFYALENGANARCSTWDAGDSYAYIGEKIRMDGYMVYMGDRYLEATNILQKFDDTVFDIPKGTTKYLTYGHVNGLTSIGHINTLFAAKPDKSGWTDDTEMNNTHEEQLIYFKSIDDLHDAGYTCVGVLYEVRDSKLYPNNSGGGLSIEQMLNMKKTAKAGYVAQIKNDVRSWKFGTDYTYLDKTYDASIKAYGIGDMSWSSGKYADDYTKPTYRTDLNYGKAVYKDGTMVAGHTNSYVGGNSILIIGNKTAVGIKVADMTGDKSKSVYDLDAGERTAKFSVQPSTIITSLNSEVQTSDAKDNLRVSVVLPKGLHFNDTGVSLQPESVKENDDGTTKIVWKINDVKVGSKIDPIVFSTTIGEEGTVKDVHHNDTFNVVAKVTSDNDTRQVSVSNGNYSETQITVIKLAASAVTKRVLTPYLELNQDVKFKLRYSNVADADALNAKLYDILSWNGDGRGSDFHGKYKLKSVRFDFSKAPQTFDMNKSNVVLSVSTDSRSQDKALAENYLVNTTGVDFTKVPSASIDEDKREVSFSNLDIKDVKAVYAYLGKVSGHEYVDTYITLTTYDDGDARQLAGDVYANNFIQWADNQASTVVSNIVKAVVVSRDASGYVWFDKNEDGVRQADEVMTDNVRVRIYRTDKSAFDKVGTPVRIDDKDVYEAFDIYGNSLNKSDVMTDEHGYWYFSNLEAGEYYVTVDIPEKYHITAYHKGEDTTVDSDAYEIFNTVFIKNIRMPGIDNMTDKVYESDFNDTGLIRNTDVDIWKVSADDESNLIAGAKLALYNASDVNEDGSVKQDAVPVDTWSTEAGVSKSFKNILTAGREYVLVETDVPEGYEKASPVRFTVNEDAAYQKVVMVDEYKHYDVKVRKLNKQNELIAGAKMRVTGTEAGTNRKIEPVEWVTEADKPFTLSLRKGDYVLSEVEAPAGYLKAEDVQFSVDDKGHVIVDDKQVDTVDMVDSYVKPGSITVNKFDTDGETPLSGVTYKLTFVKAKYPELAGLSDYKRLLKVGESTELTTDAHGRLVFENLDQGEYTLVETHTVKGHQLLKDEIKVTLPVVMSKAEAEDTNADVSKADLIDDEYHFYDVTYDVTNDYSFTVPMTGGANDYRNYLPILFGFAVLAMAYVCLNRKKKIASDMEE